MLWARAGFEGSVILYVVTDDPELQTAGGEWVRYPAAVSKESPEERPASNL